jgi:capsular exopolysaccharide synthesis family protein
MNTREDLDNMNTNRRDADLPLSQQETRLLLAQGDDDRLLPPEILQYWQVVLRWRWVIAGIIGASLAIGLIVTLLTSPLYSARGQIEISREQKNVTNVEGIDRASESRDMEFYDTQYALLKAESLAERVGVALKLQQQEAFFESHGVEGSERVDVRKRQVLSLLLKNIVIEPVKKSKLVNIKYTSRSPAMSARIADAWVREFIGASMDRQFSSNADARRFLEERLSELRRKLEISERAMVTYASQKGIVELSTTRDAEGKTQSQQTLASADLAGVNEALIAARTDRIAAQSKAASGAAENSAEALANLTISNLRQRRGEAAADYARLMTQFEPGYPAALAIKEQIDALDAAIAREASRVGASRRQGYAEAKSREQALEGQVGNLKSQLDRQQRDSIQYSVLVRDADTNRQLYDALLQRYKEIGIAGAIGTSNISIVDKAKIPTSPSAPSLPLNLAVALLVGMGASLLALFALEQMNQGIHAPEDVPNLLGLPLLGNVPLAAGDPQADLKDPKSHLSEAYFSIRSALAFATTRGVPRSLGFTSTRPAEGKSTSSLALAQVIASTGKSVLLVDADLRSPSLHYMFGVKNTKGFSNLLTGADDVKDFVQATDFPGLSFMPSGPKPPNPSELLSNERLGDVLRMLEGAYDHVVVDCPPVLGLSDAPLLAQAVVGLVFVVEPEGAPVRGIRQALGRVRMLGGNILGVIVTKIDPKKQNYGYGYGNGYGYGYGAYGYGSEDEAATEPSGTRA